MRTTHVMREMFVFAAMAIVAMLPPAAHAQADAAAIDAQKDAMKSLSAMEGVWRGPAWIKTPTGETMHLTQTERVGPFLDGALKVIEGRGYDPDGKIAFNAFGIISYDPAAKGYNFRTYAMGRQGDYRLNLTDDGYVWEIPAGKMTIRYTAVIRDDEWHEVGERMVEGQPPVRFVEMTLRRVGNSDWPDAGAIPPR